jgi:riboflavin kinase / FMN adenylyltransferase
VPAEVSPESGFVVQSHWRGVPEELRGLAIALGNFDGLHRGHMAVLDAARAAGDHGGRGWALATFEPPPRVYFGRSSGPFRLMTPEKRAEIARELGARAVFELPFSDELAHMDDEAFIDRVIAEGLGAAHVAVGGDFRFGRGRVGTTESLVRHCAGHGIATSVVVPVLEQDGADAAKVSSTTIREALSEGDPRLAASLLGRWWTASGKVEHGEKRGRTIGFPTANTRLGELIEPRHGIYAVAARFGGGPWHAGVANFGRTPTTGERDPLLEVHVFDFNEQVYGKPMEVAFMEFLRAEARFGSLEELVSQMHTDAESARKSLTRLGLKAEAQALPPVPNV